MIFDKEKALMRAEALCARSEQCSSEISAKLRRWGLSSSDAQWVLDRLIDDRFVDDSRFARAFAIDKMRFSGHGRRKIAMALALKRIPREIIDDALAEIDDEEYAERLRGILAAKGARMEDACTFEGRTKLFRFGVGRGFETSLVSSTVKSLFPDKKQ